MPHLMPARWAMLFAHTHCSHLTSSKVATQETINNKWSADSPQFIGNLRKNTAKCRIRSCCACTMSLIDALSTQLTSQQAYAQYFLASFHRHSFQATFIHLQPNSLTNSTVLPALFWDLYPEHPVLYYAYPCDVSLEISPSMCTNIMRR